MTLGELRDILSGVIEEYGTDKTVHVPLDLTDEDNLQLFPADVAFIVRENEDVDGNIVAHVAVAVFALEG